MTEAEWLASDDPDAMLHALLRVWRRPSRRKLRLFACACCRHVPAIIDAEGSLATVETVERYADGLAERVELSKALSKTWGIAGPHSRVLMRLTPSYIEEVRGAIAKASGVGLTERPYQADLLRDIFGPRRRGALQSVVPSWLTSTVLALAEGSYAERAFDRLPILADALQDAGCENADILTHLRGDGPHVRGCWALDLILGKQ